ncbi:SNARE protein TLG2/Syntaxin 16 [Trachipleistophora hominis]|uniref:SNARE protein TLG2/Syntaxin 16 n=1 Tax=Trachipleistophora hominis TaxID=72359 RepID=L7JU08_TRAHO|nr:SNARE protein TLG2/Syntaxin 16 [Trachipleistophora hominis]
MLKDLTSKYLEKRNTPTAAFIPILLPIKIRESLDYTTKQLFNLKLLQERQCLPSFSKRKQKREEINKLKNEIRVLIVRLENYLKEINGLECTLVLKKRMKDYFAQNVHSLLVEYREMQQKYLRKVKNLQIFDDLEDTRPFQPNNNQSQQLICQKKQNDIESIRSSLYFITSVLLEMKAIIASHSNMIDRIDYLVDEANSNLRMANKEIEKIPSKYGGLKDRFIVVLLFITVCLLLLLVLKIYRKRLNLEKFVVINGRKMV